MVITAQNTKQKPGYKQTEVGMIPEDWNIETLEGVCVAGGLVRGPFGGAIKKEFFVKDGFKVYEQRNAIYRDADLGSYFIDENKYKELKRFEVKEGDFIISCSGTIGKIFQIPKNAKAGVINQALLKIKTDIRVIHDQFFYYVFDWDKFQQKIIDNTQGGAMQNLVGMNIFRNIPIPLPSLPEQQAIATALSDVDALITSLDKLIAKKRDIKQATMQQLLTGKTRLPEFSGEWKVRKLGEIAEIDGDNLSSGTHPDYSFKYISLEDVDTGILKGYSEINFRDAPSRARRKVKKNDILVSTVRPNLKSHLYIIDDIPDLVCSTGFSVLRCYQVIADPSYVYFHLFAEEVGRQIESLLTGSNYPAINSGDVRALQIPFPPLSEQRAIAAILTDMDAEIAALEQKRDKTRVLKQGMMQELLTGKTRLI
jgi:type I restriction enzyme S subunit